MHVGVWLITLQIAENPHDPGQGSMHFPRMQALFEVHSELIEHSGLQLGGAPINVCKQEHDATPLVFLHCEFGPHGEGTQGSFSICLITVAGAE